MFTWEFLRPWGFSCQRIPYETLSWKIYVKNVNCVDSGYLSGSLEHSTLTWGPRQRKHTAQCWRQKPWVSLSPAFIGRFNYENKPCLLASFFPSTPLRTKMKAGKLMELKSQQKEFSFSTRSTCFAKNHEQLAVLDWSPVELFFLTWAGRWKEKMEWEGRRERKS